MRSEVNKVRLTILLAMLFSALCAGVFRTPPILFMAALLCSAPLVGLLVGMLGNRGLHLTQRLPESGTVGDLVSGEMTLRNRSRLPVFLVQIRCSETPATSRSTFNDAARRNAVVPVGAGEHEAPVIGANGQAVWRQQWLLQRRGVHEMTPARAGALDPLGLHSRLPVKSPPQRIVALPRPVKIDQLGFLGGFGPAHQTPRHSTMVADAMDFHGVRPWQPGEAIRRAHWKSTARTGRLHVVEWEETPTADLAIFLDTHAAAIAGDEADNTLESAITAAASVVCHLLENGCRLQVFFFSPATEKFEANAQTGKPILQRLQARSVEGNGEIMRALAEITPVAHPAGDLAHLVSEALPQVARGLGVLLLSSSRADLASALATVQSGIRGALCHAIAFDAESYQTASRTRPPASQPITRNTKRARTTKRRTNRRSNRRQPAQKSDTESAAPAPSASRLARRVAPKAAAREEDGAIQTISRDDSLAAALEHRW